MVTHEPFMKKITVKLFFLKMIDAFKMKNSAMRTMSTVKDRMRRMRSESGFTLVELTVILVILGILVTSFIMKYIDLSNSAQAGACRMNQLSLQTAQNMYYTEKHLEGDGHYSDSVELLVPYMMKEINPVCPSGGAYILHASGQVTCTVNGHSR